MEMLTGTSWLFTVYDRELDGFAGAGVDHVQQDPTLVRRRRRRTKRLAHDTFAALATSVANLFVAVQDRPAFGEGDCPFLHLFNEHPVRSICIFKRVDLLCPCDPGDHDSIHFARTDGLAVAPSASCRRAITSETVIHNRYRWIGRSGRTDQSPASGESDSTPARTLSLSERSPPIRRKGFGKILTSVGVAMTCNFPCVAADSVNVDDFEIVPAVEDLSSQIFRMLAMAWEPIAASIPSRRDVICT